jgi:hypothetical protein
MKTTLIALVAHRNISLTLKARRAVRGFVAFEWVPSMNLCGRKKVASPLPRPLTFFSGKKDVTAMRKEPWTG